MAALANITLGTATFVHVRTSANAVTFVEQVPASAPSISAASLVLSWVLDPQKTVYRVKLVLAKPILTVPPSGSVAKPSVAYVTRSSEEYFLPVVGTTTERQTHLTQMRAAIALPVVTSLVQNLIPANL